ncbi:ABC transporter permease [Dictyobacter formicarum]|nr:ABC transporter permease [Dictyobacter formicarum]
MINMLEINRSINAVLTIAYRDILRFLRDPARLFGTIIFPILFVGVLGSGFQNGYGNSIGYDVLQFIFTGVLAQTVFLSTSAGIVSLIEDRENNFSQEIFISPISRYTIVFGKIFGESLVAMTQAVVVLIFGLVIGLPLTPLMFFALLLTSLIICLFGGSFGLIMLSLFGSQRAANQIMPFLIFPQFFLAGIFSPINHLPWYLDIISRIAPLRYAADLMRSVYFLGTPAYSKIVLINPILNFIVIVILFTLFLIFGTIVFVRSERNK